MGYRLTLAADQDFENIFEFGLDKFGLGQALSYQQGMVQRFDKLVEQPKLYPTVDHIRNGYRRSVYGSHSIYYRVESRGLVIVRNLGQQDLAGAFS